MSTAGTTKKAEQARSAGYEHVIDLSKESLKDGVLRVTEGKGVDVVVDGVSGKLTGQALASLAYGGTVVVVGYAGGREAEVSITDIIWKAAKSAASPFACSQRKRLRRLAKCSSNILRKAHCSLQSRR